MIVSAPRPFAGSVAHATVQLSVIGVSGVQAFNSDFTTALLSTGGPSSHKMRCDMITERISSHLRKTFFAGIFAAIPLAVTAFILWYVESRTREIARGALGLDIPFIGIVLTVALVYLTGLAVTSIVGKFFLGLLDRVLSRLPVLREVYRAWKQVSLTPTGTSGIFSKVVLIADETGRFRMIGFSTGQPIPGDPSTTAVFVPAAPNPTSGRIYFVSLSCCQILDMSADEAFKLILSGGTYIPAAVGSATGQSDSASLHSIPSQEMSPPATN
jgi:uncharacterized membrane protein